MIKKLYLLLLLGLSERSMINADRLLSVFAIVLSFPNTAFRAGTRRLFPGGWSILYKPQSGYGVYALNLYETIAIDVFKQHTLIGLRAAFLLRLKNFPSTNQPDRNGCDAGDQWLGGLKRCLELDVKIRPFLSLLHRNYETLHLLFSSAAK